MKILKVVQKSLNNAKSWLLKRSLPVKVVIIALILGLGWFSYTKIKAAQTTQVQYQTAIAEKGTLINSISGSGSITSGNNTNVNTKVSGVVNKVYVTNGDKVTKGQKIADITLDDYAQERQTAAWVSYLEATEGVKDADKLRVTADIQMWNARQTLLDAETNYKDMVAGAWNHTTNKEFTYNEKAVVTKTFEEAKKSFSAYESKYINSGADISYSYAKVSSALRNYQENSATVISPASGTISDLMLAPGIILSANSATSNTSGATIVSSQIIGKISNPNGQLIATTSLTEIDIIKVKANQKVSLTLDAYPDNTFTGKVLAVNTNGSVSSGVTSYPVTILLDPVSIDIYPNMAVNAQIITNIKTDVILVPSTAIIITNNQSTVQIMKDKKPMTVDVEVGSSNDSQTEIISGINEGDEVITSTISATSTSQTSTSNTTSPFSGLGRTGGSTTRTIQGGPPGGFDR